MTPQSYVENFKDYSDTLEPMVEKEELDFVKKSLQMLLDSSDDVTAKIEDLMALSYVTDVLEHADTFFTRPSSFRQDKNPLNKMRGI